MQRLTLKTIAVWISLTAALVASARARSKANGLETRASAAVKAQPIRATATAQTAADALRAMFDVRTFREVSISPDGKRIAWVEELPAPDGGPSPNSAIYIAELNAPAAVLQITASNAAPESNGRAARTRSNPTSQRAQEQSSAHEEHDVAWSPDGTRLAFLSDAATPGQLQLFVVDASASAAPARQLTHFKGHVTEPRWSPDGKTIALLYIGNAPHLAGPLAAEPPDEGVIEDTFLEQRLTLVDPASGNVREISPPDLYVYEFDWSPDSSSFVITAAHGNGDNNWWIARLYSLTSTGAMRTILPHPKLQMANPRWSPDGKQVAFIGGLMSDEGVTGGDIYTVSAGGGEPRDVTPGMRESASSLSWADPQSILFTGIAGGETVIDRVSIADGAMSTLWKGAERVSDGAFRLQISLARDAQTSAVIRQSYAQPPEVWAGPIGNWKQVTHTNAGLRPAWGKAESIDWTTAIGTVQGWLVYPLNFVPAKKYPMVVVVHGGPASATLPSWPRANSYFMGLPSQGYFLLLPNPRGSYGQGEKFTQANVKDFGYGDWVDILAGVDQAIQSAPIDPNRLGITGWSYGGFMTMWGVTQTNRFRAAVSGAGLADWLSYYGENKIDEWMIPYFGASVYDDPAVYAKSSPINFIKQTKTPTLIVVGDRDGECPAPQSFEFWHALKTLGVPTQLVVYPDEGHGFRTPAHNRDVMERTIAWFNRYLESPE
jgi:dipeptidyl aminopeptidase/acylaminoacyl peptidase